MTFDASFWDARFARDDYIYGTDPNEFVAATAGRIPPGPVLCLAEGEGRNAVHLATLGHEVTAVDQSSVGLAKATRLAARRGVPLRTEIADLADYAITPETWAGVVAVFIHLPPDLRRRVFRAAVRGLRPGGVFVLEAFSPAQLAYDTGGPKDVNLLMTTDALRQDLAGLHFEILHEIERDVIEGPGHSGRAAVVQVLGVRQD